MPHCDHPTTVRGMSLLAPPAGLVVLPGAGGDRDQRTLVALERDLADAAPDLRVVRAHFANRDAGRKGPERPAVAVAQGERVDVDAVVDHVADLHPEGQLRVPLRDRDHRHPLVDRPVQRAELAVERSVVRGHDGHVEPLAVHRAHERVVVDHVGAPLEDPPVGLDRVQQLGRGAGLDRPERLVEGPLGRDGAGAVAGRVQQDVVAGRLALGDLLAPGEPIGLADAGAALGAMGATASRGIVLVDPSR